MKYIAIGLILIISCMASAQSKFNNLYDWVKAQAYNQVVIANSEHIYTMGKGTNNIPYSKYGYHFTKYDLNGIVIDTLYFEAPDQNSFYSDWIHDACWLNDSTIITVMLCSKNDYLVKLDAKHMKLIDTIGIYNPSEDYDSQVIWPNFPTSINYYKDHFLIADVVTHEGNKISKIKFYKPELGFYKSINLNNPDYITGIFKVSEHNGYIYAAGTLSQGNIRYNDPPFKIHATIIKIDSLGNEIWRYISDEAIYRSDVFDMVVDDNGEVAFTQSFGSYNIEPIFKDNWIYIYRPGMGKLDKDGNLLYEIPLGYNKNYYSNYFHSMVKSNEGDGYIMVGEDANFDLNDDCGDPPACFTNVEGDTILFEGIISKVSNDGDSLWTRYYQHHNKLFYRNPIYDITPHPHGGYIISGSATDTVKNNPQMTFTTKSWLAHIDEYGCLVPGCQDSTSSAADVEKIEGIDIKIYPNPATESLYIYQGENEPYQYDIIDMAGKKIGTFSIGQSGMTTIIDISKYKSGAYLLSIKNKKGDYYNKKFIKN
jgi:hypothetical protein